MPMNRVQFQPGLSMREFLSLYGTEERCEAALIASRLPRGLECPRCGVCESRTGFQRQGRRYWQCAGCHPSSTLTARKSLIRLGRGSKARTTNRAGRVRRASVQAVEVR